MFFSRQQQADRHGPDAFSFQPPHYHPQAWFRFPAGLKHSYFYAELPRPTYGDHEELLLRLLEWQGTFPLAQAKPFSR
ncbi:hypothetical protein [Mumia zhuanghuii]|uniref:Uncharacterized protein n=1 Tax=Mumia zhuanghuii TaxID=2585211 RepID=A0A5C4M8D3_9ACTN|nr:hypothetical protein [Mumia zhuanghuii]TNC28417.1 hypothetical protein FHE65_33900 [Mumia zhuanghuii]